MASASVGHSWCKNPILVCSNTYTKMCSRRSLKWPVCICISWPLQWTASLLDPRHQRWPPGSGHSDQSPPLESTDPESDRWCNLINKRDVIMRQLRDKCTDTETASRNTVGVLINIWQQFWWNQNHKSEKSHFYLLSKNLNIFQTTFPLHLGQFSQRWVFIFDGETNTVNQSSMWWELSTFFHFALWSQSNLPDPTQSKSNCGLQMRHLSSQTFQEHLSLCDLFLLGFQLSDGLHKRSQQGDFGPLGLQFILITLLLSHIATDSL